jgi:hypothetical protein
MMSIPWVSFLLATTTAPKTVMPQGSSRFGNHHTRNFAERDPQFDHTFTDSRQRESNGRDLSTQRLGVFWLLIQLPPVDLRSSEETARVRAACVR